MQHTTEYDVFKFRKDNRETINKAHIDFLITSIKADNRLADHPIRVTREGEVINGQHRLLAAKALGVPIFYEYVDNPSPSQMAIENMNKQWSDNDYLHLYCSNGYEEYIKLKQFMDNNKVNIKFALAILKKEKKEDRTNFKMGNFKFSNYEHETAIKIIWETIDLLRAHGMKGTHLRTVRFWQALIILFTHEQFEEKLWYRQVCSHAHRFVVKARMIDYLAVIEHVYNFSRHTSNQLRLTYNVTLNP